MLFKINDTLLPLLLGNLHYLQLRNPVQKQRECHLKLTVKQFLIKKCLKYPISQ
jgi:hypothetical protein